ncbi:hypothetical protein SNEBB_008992 [Seison nebaliae]|nr:hypothetical protein SNEBB_008992 [Seison nebaliae]
MDSINPVIVDCGSGAIKAGMHTDEAPSVQFACCYGRVKYPKVMVAAGRSEFVGDQAEHHRGILDIVYPIQNGIVNDWDAMEKIWHHTFYNELRISPEEHPFLFTEAPLNPKANREKMAELCFEKFDMPAIHIEMQAVLSLYANGLTTGVTLDSGDGVTHSVPVYEGYALKHAIVRSNLAGRSLTERMAKLLSEANFRSFASAEYEICRQIKEKCCYVSMDYEKEMNSQTKPINYTLPDGQVLSIGKERFRCPEALFQPHLLGMEMNGIHESFYESIMKSDIDLRRTLFRHIVISGGTTLFPDIEKRLEKELYLLAPRGTKIKVIAPIQRKYSVWMGGQILASLASFASQWVSKRKYDEYGATIINRVCL